MTQDELGKMTLAQLQDQFVVLGDQLSVIAEDRRLIDIEIRTRLRKAVAQSHIDGMSADDLDALKSVLATTTVKVGIAVPAAETIP